MIEGPSRPKWISLLELSFKKVNIFSLFVYMSVCVCVCVCMLVTQSCLTLCDPMDCNPPGSSVQRILQARILEWVVMLFSRGSLTQESNPFLLHLLGCKQILYPPSHHIYVWASLEACPDGKDWSSWARPLIYIHIYIYIFSKNITQIDWAIYIIFIVFHCRDQQSEPILKLGCPICKD